MNDLTLKIVLGVAAVAWLAACTVLYKAFRGAAWLAGPTVASCMALTGVAVMASLVLPEALCLAPLWLAITLLSALHLYHARAPASALKGLGGSRNNLRGASAPASALTDEDTRI